MLANLIPLPFHSDKQLCISTTARKARSTRNTAIVWIRPARQSSVRRFHSGRFRFFPLAWSTYSVTSKFCRSARSRNGVSTFRGGADGRCSWVTFWILLFDYFSCTSFPSQVSHAGSLAELVGSTGGHASVRRVRRAQVLRTVEIRNRVLHDSNVGLVWRLLQA